MYRCAREERRGGERRGDYGLGEGRGGKDGRGVRGLRKGGEGMRALFGSQTVSGFGIEMQNRRSEGRQMFWGFRGKGREILFESNGYENKQSRFLIKIL